MTEVEFLRRELERQLKAVDDLNKMIKDLSQITFESKMDKWLKASKTKDEPVAWMSEDEHTVYTNKQVDGCFQHDHIPLYTTPQTKEWVSLTNEQIEEIWGNTPMMLNSHNNRTRIVFAKAIEAKLREKNT